MYESPVCSSAPLFCLVGRLPCALRELECVLNTLVPPLVTAKKMMRDRGSHNLKDLPESPSLRFRGYRYSIFAVSREPSMMYIDDH